MNRRQSSALATTASLAVAGLLVSGGPTRADDAGISGGVESVLELALEPTASGRVATTVTTTVSRARLSVGGGHSRHTVAEFDGPVTNQRTVESVDDPRSDSDATFTLGPQGP